MTKLTKPISKRSTSWGSSKFAEGPLTWRLNSSPLNLPGHMMLMLSCTELSWRPKNVECPKTASKPVKPLCCLRRLTSGGTQVSAPSASRLKPYRYTHVAYLYQIILAHCEHIFSKWFSENLWPWLLELQDATTWLRDLLGFVEVFVHPGRHLAAWHKRFVETPLCWHRLWRCEAVRKLEWQQNEPNTWLLKTFSNQDCHPKVETEPGIQKGQLGTSQSHPHGVQSRDCLRITR